MLQTVQGREVYVIHFAVMPQLPIIPQTEEEAPYAKALTAAFYDGVITEPGKYGIEIVPDVHDAKYNIYRISE